MHKPEKVRESVSRNYARAVTSPSGDGCCSGVAPKITPVALAGYETKGLEGLPPEAVTHSFGCGDPLAFSGVAKGEVVLDLGSGAGIDLLIAAEKVGPAGRVIGVDMTDEMIAKAEESIAASGFTNIEVRKGIIEDLPVESSSVDWVISNCVINLSPEKLKVFAEIARVLKPGGRMLVSDIVAEQLPDRVLQDEALYSSCVAGAISEAAYLEGMRQAGLEDTEVRERIIYDGEQLEALLGCGSAGADQGAGDGISSQGGETTGCLTETLAGRIWSAKIYARKPGG